MLRFVKKLLKSFLVKEEVVPEQIGVVFEPLDIERAEKVLKVRETAKEDGENNTPHSTETNIDSFQLKTYKYIETEVKQRKQKLNENFLPLNKAIQSINIKSKIETARNLDQLFNYELKSIEEEDRDSLTELKYHVENLTKEFNKFRAANKLKRLPKEEKSYTLYVGGLLFILAGETILNGYYFAKGDELAYVGGIIKALGIALVNLLIAFALGRLTTYKNCVNNLNKFYGYLSGIGIIIWLSVYNLIIAHYRQQLEKIELVIKGAGKATIEAFAKSPFGLESFEYWILFLLGFTFGGIAYIEGYFWDDPYPGYGEIDRRLKQARQDFYETKAYVMVKPNEMKEQKLDEITKIDTEIRSDVSYLKQLIGQKHTLIKNIKENIEQIESSSIFLIKKYREINMQHRTTDPPGYFMEIISDRQGPNLEINTEEDLDLIQRQEMYLDEFAEMAEILKNSIIDSYNRSFTNIDSISIDGSRIL